MTIHTPNSLKNDRVAYRVSRRAGMFWKNQIVCLMTNAKLRWCVLHLRELNTACVNIDNIGLTKMTLAPMRIHFCSTAFEPVMSKAFSRDSFTDPH